MNSVVRGSREYLQWKKENARKKKLEYISNVDTGN